MAISLIGFPRIRADPAAHLRDVRADGLRNIGYCVDEGDLHRQEGIRSVLDQLCALRVGDHDSGPGQTAPGRWHNSRSFIVRAVCQWLINLLHNGGARFVVYADNDAVGIQEVGDGRAFPQKFGIRNHREHAGGCTV